MLTNLTQCLCSYVYFIGSTVDAPFVPIVVNELNINISVLSGYILCFNKVTFCFVSEEAKIKRQGSLVTFYFPVVIS